MNKNEIIKWLKIYKKNNFALFPIAKGTKVPPKGLSWNEIDNRDIKQWVGWLNEGYNLALRTGEISGVIVFEIDAMPSKLKKAWYENKITEEEKEQALKERELNLEKIDVYLKENNVNTLTQSSFGGRHLFFKYDNDIPKTNIKLDDVHVDIQSDGGYLIVYPSIVHNQPRNFLEEKELQEFPKGLKELILNRRNNNTVAPVQEFEADIDLTQDIDGEELLQGQRNSFLIKFGGILRKNLSMSDTRYTINSLNRLLRGSNHNQQEIDALLRSLESYQFSEEKELGKIILDYLKIAEEATERDLKEIKGLRDEPKEKLAKALRYLQDENYIFKRRGLYHICKKANWKEEWEQEGKLLNFKMPYWEDYATFRNSDLAVLGAGSGHGKTFLSMNFIKQIVNQGIKVDYISLESGSRYAVVANALGLKKGDFRVWKTCNPEEIELDDNRVTILDWLLPKDYALVDKLFAHFNEQLEKHGGFLLVLMQLRKDGSFFAENLVEFFPAFVCKYGFEDEFDRNFSYFETIKIRESKTRLQRQKIPCKYNHETKEVLVINQEDELNGE